MDFVTVWDTTATFITNIVAVLAVISGIWVSIGRPLKRRFDEERVERQELATELAKTNADRQADVDSQLKEIKGGIVLVVERLDKINGTVATNTARILTQGDKLIMHGERLAFLEGANLRLAEKESEP